MSPEKKSAFEGEYYWVCNTCGKEFSTKEAAVIHEKNECEGLEDAAAEPFGLTNTKTSASKLSSEDIARRKKEAKRRKEEEAVRRKKEAERRIKEAEELAEEGNELDSFTYKTRESSKRFPTNTMLIGVYRFLAYLVVGACIVLGLLLLDGLGEGGALGIIVIGAVIGINLLLVSEMIKFLMDFHDANYINTKVRIKNTKVRIKTLEALQEISKKLVKDSLKG